MTEWVITGSRHGFPSLWEALDALSMFEPPSRVHVREQVGVDQDARAWCRARGYKLVEHQCDMSRPSPQRYHESNQAMVEACAAPGLAAGFPGPHSRGTWDCLRRAYAYGLRCYAADVHTRRFRPWRP